MRSGIGTWWDHLAQDMTYGARLLRSNRTASFAAILTDRKSVV